MEIISIETNSQGRAIVKQKTQKKAVHSYFEVKLGLAEDESNN